MIRRGYGPSLLVTALGVAGILAGIGAASDAATVGGIVLGAILVVAGLLAAEMVSATRRRDLGRVSGRTVARLLPDDPDPRTVREYPR